MANARKTAVLALLDVEAEKAYSNLTLNRVLSETELSSADKALTTTLFYGVLDRKITLDCVLSSFIKTPLKKIKPFTLAVLRVALYQIMFLDKIPESAAVNEAVKLVKSSKERYNASFVNGVLRNILRTKPTLPQGNDIKSLSVRFSCPEWLIKSFVDDYGEENAIKLVSESLEAPPVVLRVNTLKTNREELIKELSELGIEAESAETENAVIIKGGLSVNENPLYKKGFFHIQDTASQMAVCVLKPKRGETVLDICAAPGGKTFTMAQLMENEGSIEAYDLYEARVKLIAKGAKRLGLSVIEACVRDATVFDERLQNRFDAVLCDVPCSGLGVLRRKPEIKYKNPDEFSEIEKIQQKILENAASYLKTNGRLLYSTCTLRAAENEETVKSFLDKHRGYVLKYEHTFFPHIDKTDGFYCALLEKTGE